jgi:hypothetical protein
MSGSHQLAYSTLKSCRHEIKRLLFFPESWRSPAFLPFDGFELSRGVHDWPADLWKWIIGSQRFI